MRYPMLPLVLLLSALLSACSPDDEVTLPDDAGLDAGVVLPADAFCGEPPPMPHQCIDWLGCDGIVHHRCDP